MSVRTSTITPVDGTKRAKKQKQDNEVSRIWFAVDEAAAELLAAPATQTVMGRFLVGLASALKARGVDPRVAYEKAASSPLSGGHKAQEYVFLEFIPPIDRAQIEEAAARSLANVWKASDDISAEVLGKKERSLLGAGRPEVISMGSSTKVPGPDEERRRKRRASSFLELLVLTQEANAASAVALYTASLPLTVVRKSVRSRGGNAPKGRGLTRFF